MPLPRHIISINDLTVDHIDQIIRLAQQLKTNPEPSCLKDKIIANCFFEPSTRTRLSFEAAALRLGAHNIGFADGANQTSTKKGETLADSVRVIGQYADLLVIRHHLDGAARLASIATDKPVINAGDGSNQHPSQTLLDLYSLQESQGRLHKLNIAFVGDLKYGRTIHSLVNACSHYQTRFYFVSPESLSIPKELTELLKERGAKYSFHENLHDIMSRVDVVYMTRLQRERLLAAEDALLYQQCRLTAEHLDGPVKDNLRIMHPLPRVDEIDPAIDQSPHAYYFQQAHNGLYVRQAILKLLLADQE